MPNNKQRIVGTLASIGITVGGAWLASQLSSNASATFNVIEPAADGNLIVNVGGVRNAKGKIVVMVFDDDIAYQNHDVAKTVGYQEMTAKAFLTVIFPNLKAGPYVVSIFHDENNNQDFDYNGATPLEGYATSGVTDHNAIPSFNDASIKPGVISMTLNYLH